MSSLAAGAGGCFFTFFTCLWRGFRLIRSIEQAEITVADLGGLGSSVRPPKSKQWHITTHWVSLRMPEIPFPSTSTSVVYISDIVLYNPVSAPGIYKLLLLPKLSQNKTLVWKCTFTSFLSIQETCWPFWETRRFSLHPGELKGPLYHKNLKTWTMHCM